ncbi:MAG: hypothetical protein DI598_13820, partial [Pseudopedobacter saltans]
YDCFSSKLDTTPYIIKEVQVDTSLRNPCNTASALLSEKWNFKKEDAAPDVELNEVVWKSVKGENAIMPSPRRSAFVKVSKKKDDDDD